MAEHLLAAVREAFTNVARHSRASSASVQLAVTDGMCSLRITDDGSGIPSPGTGPTLVGGFGMANLKRRAEKLGGELVLEAGHDGGTSLTLNAPVGT